ncbi:hypothetical protein HN587_06200 [Candidatus Woesearchaeota archaeon]|jgi:transcription initiation factor TFIIE subunit alpha|nr:hypothetical protein [Candidatus Woesearchaeota archaeon]
MKLSNKLIEDVVTEVAGQDVLPLIKLIKNKKNVSEFKLAENLELEVNFVRNMLYRLYHANLVSFTRRKDKKKGWYIYYWTFRTKQIKHLAITLKKQKVDRLKDRLNREQDSHFFICKNSCMRLDFETSMNFGFKCPECGELMEQQDNVAKIKEIKDEVELLEKELEAEKPKPFTQKKSASKKTVKKKEVENEDGWEDDEEDLDNDSEEEIKPKKKTVKKKAVKKKVVKKKTVKKTTAVKKTVKKKTKEKKADDSDTDSEDVKLKITKRKAVTKITTKSKHIRKKSLLKKPKKGVISYLKKVINH